MLQFQIGYFPLKYVDELVPPSVNMDADGDSSTPTSEVVDSRMSANLPHDMSSPNGNDDRNSTQPLIERMETDIE